MQYNLFAGTIVALGDVEQRTRLYAMQRSGDLGCFAFTEVGAGVLSGAGVETTATFDIKSDKFVLTSPTATAKKNWISQGIYAEHAVILAELVIDGKKLGPHLFFTRIQNVDHKTGSLLPVKGVRISSLPEKSALAGLDNAYIEFDNFVISRTDLLSRFSSVDAGGVFHLNLPTGNYVLFRQTQSLFVINTTILATIFLLPVDFSTCFG